MRQGDTIATLLFNIMLETAVTRSKGETRGTIFDKRIQFMACSDIVVILGIWDDIQEIFTSMFAERNKKGKEINKKWHSLW